jgi:hypothetical protein
MVSSTLYLTIVVPYWLACLRQPVFYPLLHPLFCAFPNTNILPFATFAPSLRQLLHRLPTTVGFNDLLIPLRRIRLDRIMSAPPAQKASHMAATGLQSRANLNIYSNPIHSRKTGIICTIGTRCQ